MDAVLSADRFDSVTKDTYPRGLPPWAYGSATANRLELERVLKPSWQLACHISNIAAPGDYTTFELGHDSIVVLRDRAGEIRAFHNVCRHRAARLVEGNGTCRGAITCPYHGWTYNLDGTLRGLPVRESFPDLDLDLHGLVPVHVATMVGFVFVCLAEMPPPPPATLWGGMLDDLLPYQIEKMQPITPVYEEVWDVDWKVAMDNYLESYHVPVGHPGLARMFTPDYDDQLNLASGVARGVSWLREAPSSQPDEARYQALLPLVTTHLPEPNRRCWRFYSMLPNLGMDVYPDQADFFQILPRGPGKCVVRGGAFALADDRPEMREVQALGTKLNDQVNAEDRTLCARVQLGLRSSAYRPGPLSRHEICVLQFHDLIRAAIPEMRETVQPAGFV
jgi:phenylpropionate dioxygenase-like ring-hydroxylating dioxygenase large terminal subunit